MFKNESKTMLKTSEDKATATLHFKGGINFNCKLDSVEFNPNFVSKEDAKLPEEQQNKKAALIFHFSNNLGDINPSERRVLDWGTYEPKEFNEVGYNIFQQKFKHIYEVYAGQGFPVIEAPDYKSLYKQIADIFNGVTKSKAEGDEQEVVTSKPIYKGIAVNIKAVYDKQGRVGFGFPNFIEKYDAKAPTKTTLERKANELYELPSKPTGLPMDVDNGGVAEDLPF